MSGKTDWRVLPNADAVAQVAAKHVLALAAAAIETTGRFSLVLAGGRTPLAAYRLLREADIDGSKWHVFFGDERCAAPDDPLRNSKEAWDAWLNNGVIPRANIHAIPAENGPAAAARLYAETIATWQPFDLVLLGMGEDGHVASLFPAHEYSEEPLVIPVTDAPKPPPERVSLNYPAICSARHRLLLVTGASKRAALTSWQQGGKLPVSRVAACGDLIVLIDEAAAPMR